MSSPGIRIPASLAESIPGGVTWDPNRQGGAGWRTIDGDVPIDQNPDGSWRVGNFVGGSVTVGGPSATGPGYAQAYTGIPGSYGVAAAVMNPLTRPGDQPVLGLGGILGGIGRAAGGALDFISRIGGGGSGPITTTGQPPVTPALPLTGGTPSTPWNAGGGGAGPATGGPVGALCDFLPSPAKELCKAGVSFIPQQGGGTSTQTTQNCPAGYTRNAAGQCVTTGVGRYLPGDIGAPDVVWTAINGAYGAGVTPVLVQRNVRACPAGHVLGKDGVCYRRLARTNRAHNPGAKPLLTGGDMNAIRRTKRLKKRWSRVASAFNAKVVRSGAKLKKAPK